MSRYGDQVRDEYGRTVPGVSIYVYVWDADAQTAGDLDTLTDDLSAPLANPLTSDADGLYYFNAIDGQKLIEYHYGGKVEFRDLIQVGPVPVPQAVFGGFFTNAHLLTIPLGMDAIGTTGYSALGVGAASYVYDATVDAAYVTANPRSSFMSANSRGFRIDPEQEFTPQMFGAKADGVTDDYAAFVAALVASPARGGSLYVPRGYYRRSQKLFNTKQVRIHGEGYSQNPGNVGGVLYSGAQLYTGSIICPDAEVGGDVFVAFTDNASNATAYEYQSSTGSGVRDIMYYSPGGTGTTAHGIENYVVLDLDNVRVEGFAGYGVKTAGDGSATANQFGNTALSNYRSVSCRFNKLSGFHTSGSNSSVIEFVGCDSAGNGGVGFFDATPFGNFYAACHTSANNASYGTPAGYSAAQRTQNTTDWAGLSDQNAGSFVSTQAQGFSVYSACYVEFDTGYKAELTAACIVLGGLLATDAAHTSTSIPARWNKNIIKNIAKLYADTTGSIEIAKGFLDITEDNVYTAPSTGGRLQYNATSGLALSGVGTNYDVGIRNASSASVLLVAHNSTQVLFPGSISVTGVADAASYKAGGTQVVGARKTGWAVDTGTSKRTANATYAAGTTLTFSAAYVQAEQTAMATRMAAVEAALQDAMQTIKALKDDLHGTAGHGLIGT